ncbi:hypothetical protein ACOMHN_038565 [Nucella lapillus]
MLDSPELTKTGGCHFSLPRHLTLTYFHNNRVKVIFTLTFIFLNLAAGALNAWLYRDHNWFLIVARLAGMGLNVSCCVAMGLTLRKTLTLLHRPPLAAWLPLDHHVLFHKMAGYCIVFLSLVHTLSHVANAAIYLSPSVHLNLAQCLFTLRAEVGWVAGFAPLSGVVLFLLILLLFLSSMEYVRKWSCFEVFYWTHKLSLPIVLLAVLHATHFWKWIIAPFLLYCLEQGLKLTGICTQCSVRGHQPHIHGVSLFPSGVAELKITRPRGFDFHAGDYIFLNIPAIARYEWHPFTISSAPQNKAMQIPRDVEDGKAESAHKVRVDFVWLNRDLHSFDWLLPALTELERSQSRDDGPGHVIDMQMYLTSAPTREDLRGVGLQAAVDAVFRRQGRDFFTGLTTTPTRLGRPNFDEIFKDIALKAKGKIQVFFCGSPALRNTVKTACELHGFHFCREHF